MRALKPFPVYIRSELSTNQNPFTSRRSAFTLFDLVRKDITKVYYLVKLDQIL